MATSSFFQRNNPILVPMFLEYESCKRFIQSHRRTQWQNRHAHTQRCGSRQFSCKFRSFPSWQIKRMLRLLTQRKRTLVFPSSYNRRLPPAPWAKLPAAHTDRPILEVVLHRYDCKELAFIAQYISWLFKRLRVITPCFLLYGRKLPMCAIHVLESPAASLRSRLSKRGRLGRGRG